ncbi:MAG TPA: hypothetical protein GXX41_08585 [Thermoanaerobacterium sp.]|nr:hypothetical protein [Thermoanaerobacterium sp.]
MDRKLSYLSTAVVGLVLLFLGGFVFTKEELKMVSSLCIGLGSAILVFGIGNLLGSFMVSAVENKRIKQLIEIEVNDERNTRIREKVGYMTSKIMNYVILVLVMALGFMNVNKMVLIMVASLLLIELALVIFFSNYFSKRM